METLTLTELGRRMARRWRTLVAGACTGLVLGLLVVLATPTRYEATTVLFVDTTAPELVDMAAEVALAGSRRVTAEALDALGTPGLTVTELERAAGATAVRDSRVLQITYAAGDPGEAVRGADAVAQAYVAVRSLDQMAAPGTDDARVEGTVVDPARRPTSPVGPGLLATLLGTTTGGLLVAGAAATRPTRSPAAPAS